MKRQLFFKRLSMMLVTAITVGFFGVSVNVQAAEAPKHAVFVNRIANCVTVYGLDANGQYTVPERSFLCSVGQNIEDTPLGVFRTSDYYKWRKLFGNSYGRYAIRFNGHILFHSVPYSAPSVNALKGEEFNKLGEGASQGCVRMAVADLKWIYDNCKAGTPVVVYDDATNPSPLGKPVATKIDLATGLGNYDPTEVAANNPWTLLNPVQFSRQGAGNGVINVPVGTNLETLKNYIGVLDNTGVNVDMANYSLEINGIIDFNVPGTYNVWVTSRLYNGLASQQQYTIVIM